ncbi:hypothetical protein PG996_007826 [Apiospora saccharicola]|uniref:Uncharacterized protein n=1 Tax=Apiospora saccharicola TaxID=335842 RepID=A0ABR1UW51_9PEZI
MSKHNRNSSHGGSSSRRLPPIDYDSSDDDRLPPVARPTLEPRVSTSYSSSTAGFDYYAKDRTSRATTGSSYNTTASSYGNTRSAQDYGSGQYPASTQGYGSGQYPASTQAYGSSQYSSSAQGYGSSHYSANVQGAQELPEGRKRNDAGKGIHHHTVGLNTEFDVLPQRASDSGKKHSSSSSKRTSTHRSSRSSCKDPSSKGRRDDYSDDDESDGPAPRGYGGYSSGVHGSYQTFRAY